MGCDFSWMGFIPDVAVQAQAVAFASTRYTSPPDAIEPRPDLPCEVRYFAMSRETEHRRFEFFGIAPFSADFEGCDQFVFDRGDRGRIVRLLNRYQTTPPPWDVGPLGDEPTEKLVVDVVHGGYARASRDQSYSEALWFYLFSVRFCPMLQVRDDYSSFRRLRSMIQRERLANELRDPELSFEDAWTLVSERLERVDALKKRDAREPPQDGGVDGAASDEPVMGRAPPLYDANLSIETLDLNVRAQMELKKAEIETLGQLMQFTESELVERARLGRKVAKHVREMLRELGLDLRVK